MSSSEKEGSIELPLHVRRVPPVPVPPEKCEAKAPKAEAWVVWVWALVHVGSEGRIDPGLEKQRLENPKKMNKVRLMLFTLFKKKRIYIFSCSRS